MITSTWTAATVAGNGSFRHTRITRSEMRRVRSRAVTPHSLVEGLTGCDAEFYGKWLWKAGTAETLWKRALTMPIFNKRVERLIVAYIPDFGISATALLSQIARDHALVALDLWGEGGEEFAMMVDMGSLCLAPWTLFHEFAETIERRDSQVSSPQASAYRRSRISIASRKLYCVDVKDESPARCLWRSLTNCTLKSERSGCCVTPPNSRPA